MSKYILSVMTSSVSYCFYGLAGDLPVLKEKVTVYGAKNIPSKKSGFGEMHRDDEGTPLWTAQGLVTPISDAAYEKLKDHHVFKQHLEKGLIQVINEDITDNYKKVAKIAAGMSDGDGFQQMDKDRLKQHVKVSTKSMDQDANNHII